MVKFNWTGLLIASVILIERNTVRAITAAALPAIKTTNTGIGKGGKDDRLVTPARRNRLAWSGGVGASRNCSEAALGGISFEEKLLKHLFQCYDSRVRPTLNSSQSVLVSVKFVLMQLNHLDEKSQVMATSGWMEVQWKDERLTWDPREFGGMEVIILPSQLLWLPDIALQNSADTIYHSSFMDPKFRISVDKNGSIFWIPGGKFYTNCEIDIRYYPFDDQVCMLHFTNWAYTGVQVNLTTSESEISLANYKLNGEWDVIKTKSSREDVYFYCCPQTPYPAVYFTVFLRRKYLFHVTNIITPCLMLSILVALVFCLPPDCGEKISLGITVLLSFSVFLLLIAESMPKISVSVPVISIYLTLFMSMTTLSIFVTVLVLNLHHNNGAHRVPRCIRAFAFGCLARIICMRHVVPKRDDDDDMSRPMTEESVHLTASDNIGMRLSKRRSFGDANPCRCAHSNNVMNNGDVNKLNVLNNGYTNTTTKSLDDVVDHLNIMAEKRFEEEEHEAIMDEWKALARVVDRFMFVFFLATIVLSTAWTLIGIPLAKPELTGPLAQ